MSNWSLYVITNLVNGKQYVGITHQKPEQRRNQHFSGRGSKLIKSAVHKYGLNKLSFEVWYEGSQQWIALMEYRVIVSLGTLAPSGYNLTFGGEGLVGWRHSDDTRRKMSKAQKGRTHTAEARQKLSDALKGRKATEVAKQRMSKARKGRIATDETRRKLRIALNVRLAAGPHPSNRRVLIDGVTYPSVKAAAKALGLNYSTLRDRFRRYRLTGVWPVGYCELKPTASKAT